MQENQEQCLSQGIEYHNGKRALWKEMEAIAKSCSERTGVGRNALFRVKDYLHYRGRGWGSDCLLKSEEPIRYPDRVSPTFRQLVDIVTNSYATGKEDLLDVYLEAIKERGISISIDATKFTRPSDDAKVIISDTIDRMDPIQTDICEKNNYMTDVLAEQAESLNLAPKGKYQAVVKLSASKQAGRDVEDKVQDEYVKMELFKNGLEAVSNVQEIDN